MGTGNVGATWQTQFNDLSTRELFKDCDLVLTANSRQIHLYSHSQLIDNIDNQIETIQYIVNEAPFEHKVIIDATASEEISNSYQAFLENGIHLICANKISSSSPQSNFQYLEHLAQKKRVLWKQNATIGAGLPINSALKDLVACGDEIEEIRGVFSGTLSWLLQTYNGSEPLSLLIEQAKEQGYSEPDPRIDLSGTDVARKLIIAARLAGFELDLNSINKSPLVQEKYMNASEAFFWQQAELFDEEFYQLWQQAKERNETLVYQAKVSNNGVAKCQIESVPFHDPLAQISPCDNIFVIKTKWYSDNPLIIRGPGAGREVTAAAVQSDLIAVLQYISAKKVS